MRKTSFPRYCYIDFLMQTAKSSFRKCWRVCIIATISIALVCSAMAVAQRDGVDKEESPSQKKSGTNDNEKGRIAFVSQRDGNSEIYVANPDGSYPLRLTQNPAEDTYPFLRPDGQKIIYISENDSGRRIYSMKLDGTERKSLTGTRTNQVQVKGDDDSPSFSFDGRKIVFATNRDGNFEIYSMNADGTSQMRITNNLAFDSNPVFSPDGSKIAFTSNRPQKNRKNQEENPLAVYIMNSDGSDVQYLHDGWSPTFDPTGKTIAFVSYLGKNENGGFGIHQMNMDGTDVRALTPPRLMANSPKYSPQGRFIIFDASPARYAIRSSDPKARGSQIYRVNADGSNLTRIASASASASNRPEDNLLPSWSEGDPITDTMKVSFPSPDAAPSLTLTKIPTLPKNMEKLAKPELLRSEIIGGKFAYALIDTNSDTLYLVLYEINNEDKINPESRLDNRVSFYRVEGWTKIQQSPRPRPLDLTMRWSPDGNFLLFQVMQTKNYGETYLSYLWDIKKSSISSILSDGQGQFISWSPDSLYLLHLTQDSNAVKKPQLVAYNRLSQHDQSIVEFKDQFLTFDWIAPHSLLYTALPPQPIQEKTTEKQNTKSAPASQQKSQLPIRPHIYIVSADNGTKKIVTQDGQLPKASLDGQWIAFFGSENPAKPFPLNKDWNDRPASAALSVMRRDGTGRKALTILRGTYPTLIWKPDNRHLLTIEKLSFNEREKTPDFDTEVKDWDTENGQWKHIGFLKTEDFQEFEPLTISSNGRFLFFRVSKITAPSKASFLSVKAVSLQAMNLQSGQVTTVARLPDAAGFDWHETPVEKAAPTTTAQ